MQTYSEPIAAQIALRREGDSGGVRVYLNDVRCLADALCSMAAEVAGVVVGDEDNRE